MGSNLASLTPTTVLLLDSFGADWSYYSSFVVLALAVIAVIALALWFLIPSMGKPLSSWVAQRRENPDTEETRRLLAARAVLGTLAHDVLKHRLLGLVSLVQSLDLLEEKARESEPGILLADHTQPQKWEGLRAELLRLCGARAAPRGPPRGRCARPGASRCRGSARARWRPARRRRADGARG